MNPSLEKPLLPKRLSLSEVRKELRLDGNEFTYCQAVNRLLDYANDGGLKIYISYNLLGYSTHKPRVSNTDDLGNVFQVVYVGTGGKPTLISTADGEIRFLSGFFEDGQQFNNISVKEFQQNGINYSCVIEDIQVLHPYDVAEYYFYIYTKDLNEFIDSELSNNNSNTSNNRKVLHSDETGINDKFSVFHNMDSLSYDEVTLTFIAGDMIEIEARKEKCKAGYEFLSLKNMTTGELNKAGLMLLSLAKNEKVPVTNKNIKHKQDLKKVINFVLSLKGEPLPVIGVKPRYYDKHFKAQDKRSRADDRAKEKAEWYLFDQNEEHQSEQSRELDAEADRLLEQNDDENSSWK